jgi:hypothetical protein
LGIGDWGLGWWVNGLGDDRMAIVTDHQSPQSPIPNP